MRTTLLCWTAAVSLWCTARAQEPTTKPTEPPNAVSQKIEWPRDRDRVVCSVAGREHTIGDVVEYVEQRHWPGLQEFLELEAGKLYFQSPLPPRWVRQFADIRALELEARAREIDSDVVDTALSDSLEEGFQHFLDAYAERQSDDLTQERVNKLLTKYQNENGLETELRGWLNAIVPAIPRDEKAQLRAFYRDYAQFFGGRVTFAHILVRTRDAHTGELLVGDDAARARRKLLDIRTRLADDGSNFEELARLISDDPVTASNGGVLADVQRFEPLLPAVICRAAWTIRNGEVVGPVESPYGLHFVKRLSYSHQQYVIYTEKLEPQIIEAARKLGHENVLFTVREKYDVELRY